MWTETFFELSNGNKFSVVHNLKLKGINSIQAAFDNWIARTDKFNQNSFINYINSKDIYKAMSKKKYLKLSK